MLARGQPFQWVGWEKMWVIDKVRADITRPNVRPSLTATRKRQ